MKLQGLKKLAMRYAPLLPGNGSIAQLFANCTSKKALDSNKECLVHLMLLDRGMPSLDVEFMNGDKMKIETRDKTVQQVEAMIEDRKSDIKTLDMLREEGYSLEKLKENEIPDLERAKVMAKPEARKLYKGITWKV